MAQFMYGGESYFLSSVCFRANSGVGEVSLSPSTPKNSLRVLASSNVELERLRGLYDLLVSFVNYDATTIVLESIGTMGLQVRNRLDQVKNNELIPYILVTTSKEKWIFAIKPKNFGVEVVILEEDTRGVSSCTMRVELKGVDAPYSVFLQYNFKGLTFEEILNFKKLESKYAELIQSELESQAETGALVFDRIPSILVPYLPINPYHKDKKPVYTIQVVRK